jgi:putative spermidine/putrescine transport system permease protein
VHNYWGVFASLLITGFRFTFPHILSYVTGIYPALEHAAATLGAGATRRFLHIYLPLLLPGILAALLLVLVRTLAMFELTFLTAGPTSQTLVVALYYAVFAAGVRAVQSIDAMAVIYMVTTLIWLLVALRFVNPTQIVGRGRA